MKLCPLCEVEKSLDDFYRHKRGHSYRVCKPCHIARSMAHHRSKPHIKRDSHLKKRFGIGEGTYEQMHQAQDGMCAICGRPEIVSGRRLAVDHDHATGEIRGLLCHSCNTGIGKLQDNPLILERAITYLRKNEQCHSH